MSPAAHEARQGPAVRRAPTHGVLVDDAPDAHEHGERDDTKPREESLIGTAGSHTPAPDARGEEPSGDLEDAEAIE